MSDDTARVVRQWQDRLGTISHNLSELNEAEFVRILRSRIKPEHPCAYQGLTLERALSVSALLNQLWDDYLAMGHVVEHALDLQSKRSVFHDTAPDIEALLTGASVALPTEAIPLDQRELTAPSQRQTCVTLDEALSTMSQRFAQARDELAQVRKAEESLVTRQQGLSQEAQALKLRAANLGESMDVGLGAFDAQALLDTAARDPMAAYGSMEQAEQQLAALALHLQGLEQVRSQVRVGLDQSRVTLDALSELVQRSRKAVEDSRQLLAEPVSLVEPTTDAAIASLQAWLDTLEGAFASARFKAAQVGLKKCQAALNAQLAQEQSSYARNRAALDELSDLEGRLTAFRAKARALVARGVVLDATVTNLKEQAKLAVRERPATLSRARRLVQAFETALSASQSKHNSTL